MKYLVNRETKEHVIWQQGMPTSSPGYTMVEADAEGWIPVTVFNESSLPEDARLDVLYGSGQLVKNTYAESVTWRHAAAYRPILDKPTVKKSLTVEPEVVKESLTVEQEPNRDFKFDAEEYMKHSVEIGITIDLLDRLDAAHEAAARIPDILAEIRERVGKHGYDLVARSPFVDVADTNCRDNDKSTQGPFINLGDWRNWERGDLVELCEGIDNGHIFKHGVLYTVDSVSKSGFALKYGRSMHDVCPISSRVNDFRFHSRPEQPK